MVRWVLLMLLLALPARAETVVVRNDYGGNVLAYQARWKELAEADLVRIEGRCDSACTMFISLPNVCIGRGALFGFHGARPKTGVPGVDLFLDMQVGRYYRGEVRKRFVESWRFKLGKDDLHFVKAERLVVLDPKIRICTKEDREE
jgi:hypothetical protein